MEIYNKLVRDKIPDIIKEDGRIAHFETVDDSDMLPLLFAKLREEARELEEACDVGRRNKILEELADVAEVFDAIQSRLKITDDVLREAQEKKNDTNGAFEENVRLLGIDKP